MLHNKDNSSDFTTIILRWLNNKYDTDTLLKNILSMRRAFHIYTVFVFKEEKHFYRNSESLVLIPREVSKSGE